MRLFAPFLLFTAATICSAQSTSLNLSPPTNGSSSVRVFPAPRTGDLEVYKHRPGFGVNPVDQNQMGCPVVLTSASIKTKARYMPVDTTGPDANSPSLDLQFRNMSGKGILWVTIMAQLKFKRSNYDLDSTTFDLYQTLPGTSVTDQKSEQARVVPLRVPAFGVGSVTLQRVTYKDGTVWTADGSNTCKVSPTGAERVIAK